MTDPGAAALAPLAEALRCAGVPRHYGRALLRELNDHLREGAERLLADGTPAATAWHDALATLGGTEAIVAGAVDCTRAVPHRAPVLAFIVGPTVAYAISGALSGPLLAFLALGEAQIPGNLAGVAAGSRVLAVVVAAAFVLGLRKGAEAFPGTRPHAHIGAVFIVLCSGALQIATSPDLSAFSVRYALAVNLAQVVLPAAMLVLEARWWRFCSTERQIG